MKEKGLGSVDILLNELGGEVERALTPGPSPRLGEGPGVRANSQVSTEPNVLPFAPFVDRLF